MKRKFLPTLLLLALSSCGGGGDDQAPTAENAPPEGYDEYMVFLADEPYDPTDPNTTATTANYIYRDALGYEQADIDARQAEALEFFRTRFGADLADPANENRLMVVPVVIDARSKYRVTSMSGETVPGDGWEVRDGGWLIIVTDASGYTLGGEFEGIHVPQGPMAAVGDYVIMKGKSPIHITYQSERPLVMTAQGDITFLCDLSSDGFGHGRARGTQRYLQNPDGTLEVQMRNVLTFP